MEIKETAFIEKKKELGQILQNSINNPDTLKVRIKYVRKLKIIRNEYRIGHCDYLSEIMSN
ncbi:MAG: hypothetical protein HOE45_07115 [Gammaproteobacteria bacterium]|jgi:hypothetical protein|nr:hypothetical protein [Gammaproteobacteria bacterium]MBT4146631.1 hypothetical protein [Gammaproteobacteria bacterium]MBT5222933.1 hypothetical protein [Gammaproteobacteria bacterium]MBT5826900.1 hypothetical protein [Gammaproteobacteria bacterium]MBT5966815.1 hypothetical protein [Gammaproteobacteria bacterium]